MRLAAGRIAAAGGVMLALCACSGRYSLLEGGHAEPAAWRAEPLAVHPLAWTFEAPANWEDVERWKAQLPHFGETFAEALAEAGETRLPRGVTLSFSGPAPEGHGGAGRTLTVRVTGVVREWTPFSGCDYLIADLVLEDGGRPLLSRTLRATSRETGRQSWLFGGRISAASRNLAAAAVEALLPPS